VVTVSRPRWLGYPAAVLVVGAGAAILKAIPDLSATSVALLLMLGVFLCAWLWQSGPGVLAAVLATLAFNFLFLPPLYTLNVQDPRNVVALGVFLVSALLIGRLSALSRLRLGLLEAERRDLIALTELSQGFLADTNREALLGVAADRLRQALLAEEIGIFVPGADAGLVPAGGASDGIRRDLVDLAFRQGSSASFASPLGGTDIYLPVPVGVQRVGVLVARGMRSSERLAEACAALLGLSLERERFVRLAREAELTKASDEMKSTLLATLAHDLKTPVAAARAAVENWAARSPADADARLAQGELDRLTRRMDELMQVVRLDAGIARPRLERVTAGEIVEAAIARFGEALASHSLYVDVPKEPLPVEADPAQITEALGHGLENAARYSPAGSRVRVTVDRDAGAVRFRVEDQGPGVAPADRERAFERFVRLTGSERTPGTGLGLFIAQRLVEMNGGRVQLDAAHPVGAIFEILLPEAG
jgi:two-component system, OmpR family, sensor histidine kinase KdpD